MRRATGSTGAAFMVRFAHYKYVHYINFPAQLFDIENDPREPEDLADDTAYAHVLKEARMRLAGLLDPDEVDRRAKMRQRELLELNSGRDAVIARGDLGFSVPPGVNLMFE